MHLKPMDNSQWPAIQEIYKAVSYTHLTLPTT